MKNVASSKNVTASFNSENLKGFSEADLLQKTFDSLTDAIFILDARTPPRIIDCNRAASTIFGYAKEEMIGKTTAFLHLNEETLKMFQSLLYPAMEKGDISFHLAEYKMKRKDGSIFPSKHSVVQLLNDEGKRMGWVSLVRDITEHKKAEERTRVSEENNKHLFENARDVIATSDPKGNVTSVNKTATEYGFTKDEIIGKNIRHFVPKKHWPRLAMELAKLARGHSVEGEMEVITPIGKRVAEYRSNPIRREGKVVGLQTILRDITERKEMEEKLRHYSEHLEELVQKRTQELLESEKRYSVLVEEASDGVAIIQDGIMVFLNKKAPEISGYSKNELIGLPFEKMVVEKYREFVKEKVGQRLRGEKEVPVTLELEIIAKTGEHVPVETSGAVINYQGRPAILGIIRDIRERKRMEEQRLKLEKFAALGELATMVAHDLRNPLTSIRNACFHIRNTCSCNVVANKTRLDMLSIIEQETVFANDIVNDLFDFGIQRLLQKKKLNINKIIVDSLKEIKMPRNIRIIKKFARKAVADVDGKQLERVFLNLIKNAIQAMPRGGTLTVATCETKNHVEIAFTDTGVGISKADMDRIFEPLFTTKAKGIGMGLVICKKIVEQHGGTIHVESKLGKGATFTMQVPKKEVINP